MAQWLGDNPFLFTLLFLVAVYVVARLVTAAYFRSKLDYQRRFFHGQTDSGRSHNASHD